MRLDLAEIQSARAVREISPVRCIEHMALAYAQIRKVMADPGVDEAARGRVQTIMAGSRRAMDAAAPARLAHIVGEMADPAALPGDVVKKHEIIMGTAQMLSDNDALYSRANMRLYFDVLHPAVISQTARLLFPLTSVVGMSADNLNRFEAALDPLQQLGYHLSDEATQEALGIDGFIAGGVARKVGLLQLGRFWRKAVYSGDAPGKRLGLMEQFIEAAQAFSISPDHEDAKIALGIEGLKTVQSLCDTLVEKQRQWLVEQAAGADAAERQKLFARAGELRRFKSLKL